MTSACVLHTNVFLIKRIERPSPDRIIEIPDNRGSDNRGCTVPRWKGPRILRGLLSKIRGLLQNFTHLPLGATPNRSLPVRSKAKLRRERFDPVHIQTFSYQASMSLSIARYKDTSSSERHRRRLLGPSEAAGSGHGRT